MKITKVNPKQIKWKRAGHQNKFSPIYETIRNLKMWQAIKVEIDEPRKHFSNIVYQNFRKSRVDFSVRCMCLDKEGKIWIFQKKPRSVKIKSR